MAGEKISVGIELTKEERRKMAVRFHFRAEDEQRIQKIYEELWPCVDAGYYIYCIKEEEKGLSFLRNEAYAVVIATLGSLFDQRQALYDKAGELFCSYAAECLGMELLEKVYKEAAQEIRRRTKKQVASYEFPGEVYPLEKLKDIFALLQQSEVELLPSYMMKPKKSAAYIVRLSEEKTEGCLDICAGCTNKSCESRRGEEMCGAENKLRAYPGK